MRRWKRLLWVIPALLGAAIAWAWFGPAGVQTTMPARAQAIEAIYATGAVEPSVMLPVAFRSAGTLAALAVDEGTVVKRGQVLARLDDKDLTSTVEELDARARYAREQFRRTQDLVDKGFVSPTELDRTRADMDAADASLRRAGTQREFMTLHAPADGVILRRDGEIGQYFPAGQALFTMSCCAPLRVTVDVDEEDIVRVHVGQKAVLRADALPGQALDGTVSQITPKGDPVSRSYRVRLSLADPRPLRVGMTIDANLIVAERANALVVPAGAVQNAGVWTVREGRLHRQAVRSGVSSADRIEILEGLDDAAHVVVNPAEDLAENRRVYERAAGAIASASASSLVGAGTSPAAGSVVR
jgi:RND family efflux transporter MFP subunit